MKKQQNVYTGKVSPVCGHPEQLSMSVAFILRRSEPPVCVEVKLMPCKKLLCTQKGCQLIKQRNIEVLEGGLNYRCRYLSSIDQLTICVRWAVTNPLKHRYLQVLGTCQAVYTVRGYTRGVTWWKRCENVNWYLIGRQKLYQINRKWHFFQSDYQ